MRRLVAFSTLWLAAIATILITRVTSASHNTKTKRVLPRPVPMGYVSFEIVDEATDTPMPGKLTFVGIKGTVDPIFARDIGRTDIGAVSAYNRAFSLIGTGALPVPIGHYDVYITRGPEWTEQIEHNVDVTAAGVEVRGHLRHVMPTPGWLSGDFHVHAAPSPDSHVPIAHRVYEFGADGVDLLVATDHNVVTNYNPTLEELGATTVLSSIPGDEITTATWGHFGAFPLPAIKDSAGHGAPKVAGLTPSQIFANVRAESPNAIIDVHHPRMEDIGYFTAGKFDRDSDKARTPGFSFDFDAIEVLNGYNDPDRLQIDAIIADWLSLLDHGHLYTATGNSDTHHLDYNLGGYPRNLIRVEHDSVSTMNPAEVAAAVKAHRVQISTGPFVTIRVGGKDIGDTATTTTGKIDVSIDVDAAPWVSVDHVTLIVGGQPNRTFPVTTKMPLRGDDDLASTRRFSKQLTLDVPKDTYVVIRVDGDKSLGPAVGDGHRFFVLPFALTNPVFIDTDGNGRYDAPMQHGDHAPIEQPDEAPTSSATDGSGHKSLHKPH